MNHQPLLAYLVADGARARLLLRHADGAFEVIEEFAASKAHTPRRDSRTRVFASAGGARSAIEPDDGGEAHRRSFAGRLAQAVNDAVAAGAFDRFVIVAPVRMARLIQDQLSHDAGRGLHAELHKDLTKLPEKALHERLSSLSLMGGLSAAG